MLCVRCVRCVLCAVCVLCVEGGAGGVWAGRWSCTIVCVSCGLCCVAACCCPLLPPIAAWPALLPAPLPTHTHTQGIKAYFTALAALSFFLPMEKTWNFKLLESSWYHAQPMLTRLVTMQVRLQQQQQQQHPTTTAAAAASLLPLTPSLCPGAGAYHNLSVSLLPCVVGSS